MLTEEIWLNTGLTGQNEGVAEWGSMNKYFLVIFFFSHHSQGKNSTLIESLWWTPSSGMCPRIVKLFSDGIRNTVIIHIFVFISWRCWLTNHRKSSQRSAVEGLWRSKMFYSRGSCKVCFGRNYSTLGQSLLYGEGSRRFPYPLPRKPPERFTVAKSGAKALLKRVWQVPL